MERTLLDIWSQLHLSPLLWGGLAAMLLALAPLLYVLAKSTGDRLQVERSLERLELGIQEWTRQRMQIEAEPPRYLRWLKAVNPLGRRIVLSNSMRDLEQKIEYAGNPSMWTVENILALKVFSVGGGALIGLVLTQQASGLGLISGLAIALAGYEIPDLYIGHLASERQNEIRRHLPDTLDLLTVTVEAGLGFDAAVGQVCAHTEGPLSGELSRYLQEKQIGMSSREALESLSARTNVDELKSFATALLQADKIGISIGPVLRELTNEMRIKRRQHAQEKAQQVPVKILVPMLLFIFPVFIIVIIGPVIINAMTSGIFA